MKPDFCRCAHGTVGIPCRAEIEHGYMKCRPCALGNHERTVCPIYTPAPIAAHLDRRCATCGLDSAAHAVPRGALE